MRALWSDRPNALITSLNNFNVSGAFLMVIVSVRSMPSTAWTFRKKSQKIFLILREAKPGGFQTAGFPTFFRERSGLCRGPFRDCSSLVLLIGRERGKGQIGKIPGESPDKTGKSRKKSGKSKKGKDRKGRTSPDREAPCLNPPPV